MFYVSLNEFMQIYLHFLNAKMTQVVESLLDRKQGAIYLHYSDVIMSMMASQITSLTII